MLSKLINFKIQVNLALKEYPEVTEEINDIHNYCMLFTHDGLIIFERELDIAINELEELLERNKEIPSHTNWGTEYETIYERDL
jgi:chaperonin cofactor prefoldin